MCTPKRGHAQQCSNGVPSLLAVVGQQKTTVAAELLCRWLAFLARGLGCQTGPGSKRAHWDQLLHCVGEEGKVASGVCVCVCHSQNSPADGHHAWGGGDAGNCSFQIRPCGAVNRVTEEDSGGLESLLSHGGGGLLLRGSSLHLKALIGAAVSRFRLDAPEEQRQQTSSNVP